MSGIVCPLLRLIRGPLPIRHGLGPCQTSPTFVCGAAELSFTYSTINELNWIPICSQPSLLAILMATKAGSSGIQSQSAPLSQRELNSTSSLSPYQNSLLLHLLLSLIAPTASHCHWKRGGVIPPAAPIVPVAVPAPAELPATPAAPVSLQPPSAPSPPPIASPAVPVARPVSLPMPSPAPVL